MVENVGLSPHEVEQAWLFEKFTGIARAFYPRAPDIRKLARLEDHATIRVTGSAEAIWKLSPKKQRR